MSWLDVSGEYRMFWLRYGIALLVGLFGIAALVILAARLWLVNPIVQELRQTRTDARSALEALRQ